MRNTFLMSEELIIVWCQDNFLLFFFFINFFLMKKLRWMFTLHNEKMLHLTKNN